MRKKLLEQIQSDPAYAAARIRVLRLDFGPPVGYPVQFRVLGQDRREVHRLAELVRDVMRTDTAVVEPNLEWTEPSKAIRFQVDQDRARALGLNTQEISPDASNTADRSAYHRISRRHRVGGCRGASDS